MWPIYPSDLDRRLSMLIGQEEIEAFTAEPLTALARFHKRLKTF